MIVRTTSTVVFACHSAACRPPRSGGTGGSSGNPNDSRVRGNFNKDPAYAKSFDEVYGRKSDKARQEMVYGKGNIPKVKPITPKRAPKKYGVGVLLNKDGKPATVGRSMDSSNAGS